MSTNNIDSYWLLGKSGEGVSIITAVKNRNENLRKTLPSWLAVRNVKEIIVIDWNSDDEVYKLFSDIKDDRLKIIRLEGYDGWRTCRAFNLAVRCATYNKIMRLDSDYLVEPGIVDIHPLDMGHFYTGYWGHARNLNEIFTNGFVYFYKEDFIKVNGYNESFQMYGYDDDDFYNRMEAIPLKKLTVHNNFVYHIPHNISLRSSEFEFANQGLEIDKTAQTDLTIRTNDYLSKVILPWGQDEKIPTYHVEKVSETYSKVEMVDYNDDYYSEKDISDGQVYGKAVLMSRDTGIPIESFQDRFTEDEIHELYLMWNSMYKVKNTQKEGFNLLISLYNESDLVRCFELLKCLSGNLQNKHIKEVTVFYDANKDGESQMMIQTFLYKHKITHHYIGGKPTFASMFSFANKINLGKCIIANSDILYDTSLENLVSKDLNNKLLTLSRKNWNDENQKYELISWDNGTPQYFSADSWIFQTPFNFQVRTDVRLGTMHSEPFLANQLYRQRHLKIYNPCLDVNSFHIQRGLSEMQRMNTDKKGIKERDTLYANEYQRLCSSDPISGVVWGTSNDIDTTSHTQYRASQYYLFVQIDDEVTDFEIDVIVKFGELANRNIWVFNPSNNKKVIDLVNSRNNNINITENDKFKKSVTEFDGKNSLEDTILKNNKDIWINSSSLLKQIDKSRFQQLKLSPVSKPKISIITPSFNAVEYIEEAILSVLNQGYDNFEHIIMDGGSDDGTVDILKKYDHLIWVSEKDSGQSDAMNKGFEKSTGDVIGYLNADDYYLPGAFEIIVPFFEQGVSFLTGKIVMKEGDDSYWINNPSNSHARWLIHWAEQAFPYNPVGYFYRREVQSHIGGYVEDNHYSMDFEFLLEVAQAYSIQRTQLELGVFRFVKGNKSSYIMEQSDFWSDNKFGYVKNYVSNFSPAFQKEYLERRTHYYKIFKDQNHKIQTLSNQKALNEAPDYLITMKIQRNIILEHNSIEDNELDIDLIGLCLLNRYDEFYLRDYLDHYKALGIQYFYLFGQGDKNEHILNVIKSEKNIKYYSVDLDTSLLGNYILNYILKKYVSEKWIVYTKASEFISLPLSKYIKSIPQLVDFLEKDEYSGIVSNNIEMIPNVDYDVHKNDIDSYKENFTNTTLQFTKKHKTDSSNFHNNSQNNYRIQRHQNDAITGITNNDRDISRIPIFKNMEVQFQNEYLPNPVNLADFNLYTKVYSLAKYIYLDLIEDDYKYYKVFDLNYDLEKKLSSVFNIIDTFSRIREDELESQLVEKSILIYSPRLLNFTISQLDAHLIGEAKNQNGIDEIKDLLTHVIALNSVTKEAPILKSEGVKLVATHEEKRMIDQIHNSYSWKIGNGIMKVVDFFIGWMPFAKKVKGN